MMNWEQLNALFDVAIFELKGDDAANAHSLDILFPEMENYFTNNEDANLEKAKLCLSRIDDIRSLLLARKSETEQDIKNTFEQWTQHKKYIQTLTLETDK